MSPEQNPFEMKKEDEICSIGSSSKGGKSAVGDDDDSSINTPSETSTSGGDTNRRAARVLGISESEHQVVNCTRWMFILCLMAAAAALAAVIYIVIDGEEQNDFETQVRYMG
jgi:hypothetical protein